MFWKTFFSQIELFQDVLNKEKKSEEVNNCDAYSQVFVSGHGDIRGILTLQLLNEFYVNFDTVSFQVCDLEIKYVWSWLGERQ